MAIYRVLAVSCFFAALSAFAETFTWTGTAGGYWGGADWNGGNTFQAGGDAVFNDAATASVLVDSDVTANKITAEDDTTILPGAIDPDAWKTAYRYYRFYIDGTRSDDGMMQLSDIMLLDAGGNEIPSSEFTFTFDPEKYNQDRAYPPNENPTNAVDGVRSTKWLDYRAGNSKTSVERAAVWLEFRFSSPRNLSGYRWYTANDATSRDPAAWRLLASQDGATWVTLDKVTGFNPTTERNVLAFQRSFAGFSKYRFKVDETRDGYGTMQISDVALYGLNGKRLLKDADFSLSYLSTAADGERTYPGGENPDCAVDADGSGNAKTSTKWLDWRLEREATRDEVWIQFDMNTPVNISAYSWSTGNDTAGWSSRNLRSWRLLASNDGTTWAPIDVVSGASPTTANETEAYRKSLVSGEMSLKVAELGVASGKTLSLPGGMDISHSAGISKTGAGTLAMGGSGDLTVNPANGFAVCEGLLDATDVTFRLGGTATANLDAPFVVGDCGGGEATAVLNGGSVYCTSLGSDKYNAMQIGANEGDAGRLYATNVNVTSRGRIRLGTGANSYAYVDKYGGDWTVEATAAYGRFLMGEGAGSRSEFYHRGGTLETWSYICLGLANATTNYFELSGGTVTQAHNNDVRIGDGGNAASHNELRVKGGTFNALSNIRVCNGAPGILTIDGGEVNAVNGQVMVSVSGDAGETGEVALNGGVLYTTGVVHGDGAEHGTLVFNGGTLKAAADGTLVGGGSLDVSSGANGGTIDNNGHAVTVEAGFGGLGEIVLAGAGTTEFTASQPDADVSFVLSDGVAKLDEGVVFASSLSVAAGARLTAPVSAVTAAAVSNLTFEADAVLGLASGSKAIAVDAVSMPGSGTVTLASAAGAPLDMGDYEVLSPADSLPDGIEEKFALNLGSDLRGSFLIVDGVLHLVVDGANDAVWTGDAHDGDMYNASNWFKGRLPANGRPAIINVSTNATLTCPSSIDPSSITFPVGCAAVTINAENGVGISGVEAIVNNSSSVQTFNVPVSFAQDIVLAYSNAPVNFASGATGRTLSLSGIDGGGWHLKGMYNLSYWNDAPYCFIDDGATVNAAAATGLGDVRIEQGGSLVVGNYTLNVTDQVNKWVVYYNKGLFRVTGTLTNTSSVKTSMFSGDSDAEMGVENAALADKPKNIIENLVNNPAGDVDFLLGKYGDSGTGYNKWVRAAYQFGSISWNSRQSRLVVYRGNCSSFYFAKSGTVSGDWNGQRFGSLEDTTYNMCDLEGNPSHVTFDCDIQNEPYGGYYYGKVFVGGGGKLTLAAGRKIDAHTKDVVVSGATTLALVPGATVTANTLRMESGATLETADSGTVVPNGNLTLANNAILGFNYSTRQPPVLDMTGKNVALEGDKNVVIRISTDKSVGVVKSGANILTSGGKFADAKVTLAVGAPEWATGVSVVDGNIVLMVKAKGMAMTLR